MSTVKFISIVPCVGEMSVGLAVPDVEEASVGESGESCGCVWSEDVKTLVSEMPGSGE